MSTTTKSSITIAGISVVALLIFVVALSLFDINWGQISVAPAATVTVSGTAKSQVSNQIASFNVGVSATNQDKQTAVDEVNTKMEEIIQGVKEFGIEDEDVQTQNVSVYQEERFDPDEKESEITGWRASNSINITLRDIDQASQLTDLLSQTGATSVNGPNFRTDDTQVAEAELVADAIENARTKANSIAKASGKSLGEVLSVNEGEAISRPMPMMAMEARSDIGGVPAPIEPGSATVSQSVTVVFELN